MAMLAAGMARAISCQLLDVLNITDVISEQTHAEFHNFRKFMRSLNFLLTCLPPDSDWTFFQLAYSPSSIVSITTSVRDSFGDLNDKITNYYYEKDNGARESRLITLEDDIIAGWGTVKFQTAQKNLSGRLAEMVYFLIPYVG